MTKLTLNQKERIELINYIQSELTKFNVSINNTNAILNVEDNEDNYLDIDISECYTHDRTIIICIKDEQYYIEVKAPLDSFYDQEVIYQLSSPHKNIIYRAIYLTLEELFDHLKEYE